MLEITIYILAPLVTVVGLGKIYIKHIEKKAQTKKRQEQRRINIMNKNNK